MLFKVALSIVNGKRPYLVQVAIPDNGKFLVHEFHFKDPADASSLAYDYFWTYQKTPEKIMSFHKEYVAQREANMELPFFNG